MSHGCLDVQGLEKNFDGIRALADFSCSVRHGEILGLLGPNGAGKTTLFNVISGFIVPDSGTAMFEGVDLLRLPPHRIAMRGIARTFQDLRLVRQLSVMDNVLLSFRSQAGENLTNVFLRWKTTQRQEAINQAQARLLLQGVGLADKAHCSAAHLSYGQQKLLTLVCCLAAKADLFLLDEPVAGIAPDMIERVLNIIRDLRYGGKSVILIEHNLDAVTRVCDRVVFMDAGTKVSEGSPQEVRNDPRVIKAYID